jgi:hypothetical protein
VQTPGGAAAVGGNLRQMIDGKAISLGLNNNNFLMPSNAEIQSGFAASARGGGHGFQAKQNDESRMEDSQ